MEANARPEISSSAQLVFDEIADDYDRARPGYPDALIDDMLAFAAAGSESTILEVGVGTGQLTRGLARRGLSVIGLEPGVRLAALARANLSAFPRVSIIGASFESWSRGTQLFDLVVAAQSFHWVDLGTGLEKASTALRPGGVFAICANIPRRGQSDLDRAIDVCYQRLAPSHRSTGATQRGQLKPALSACGFFEVRPARQYRWTHSYSGDEYVDLLRTYSDHHLLPPTERAALLEGIRKVIESHGGSLELGYESRLVIGKRAV